MIDLANKFLVALACVCSLSTASAFSSESEQQLGPSPKVADRPSVMDTSSAQPGGETSSIRLLHGQRRQIAQSTAEPVVVTVGELDAAKGHASARSDAKIKRQLPTDADRSNVVSASDAGFTSTRRSEMPVVTLAANPLRIRGLSRNATDRLERNRLRQIKAATSSVVSQRLKLQTISTNSTAFDDELRSPSQAFAPPEPTNAEVKPIAGNPVSVNNSLEEQILAPTVGPKTESIRQPDTTPERTQSSPVVIAAKPTRVSSPPTHVSSPPTPVSAEPTSFAPLAKQPPHVKASEDSTTDRLPVSARRVFGPIPIAREQIAEPKFFAASTETAAPAREQLEPQIPATTTPVLPPSLPESKRPPFSASTAIDTDDTQSSTTTVELSPNPTPASPTAPLTLDSSRGAAAETSKAVRSNATHKAPADFSSQVSSPSDKVPGTTPDFVLGSSIVQDSQPVLELAQTPVGVGYHDSIGFAPAFVPESSLTNSYLAADYQLPGLFNCDRTVKTSNTKWPCNQCGQIDCCCRPKKWSVRTDALWLQRSRADGFDTPLIRKFGNGIRPTIDCPADAIAMGMRGARQFTLVRDSICAGCDLEATYYMVDEWIGRDSVNGDVATVGFTSIGFGFASVDYESRFHNAEFNVYRDLNNWTQGMIGFRWMQFDEQARVFARTDLTPNFDQRAETENNLFGVQLGLRRSLWERGGAFTLDATAKAGVYNNRIDRTTVGFGTSPLTVDRAAFVGELNIDSHVELSRCWTLDIGYRFLWATRIAEALDQFFSPDAIYDDGDPFLHGFRIGVTRTF